MTRRNARTAAVTVATLRLPYQRSGGMIALSLAEIAAAVGGVLNASIPRCGSPAPSNSTPARSRPAGCSSRSTARRSTVTTSRAAAMAAGAVGDARSARGRRRADHCRRRPAGRVWRGSRDTSWTGCRTSTIVGLTGSSGKTTTKDFIAQLLARLGADGGAGRFVQQRARSPVHRPEGDRRRPAGWSWSWARAAPATSPI